MGGCDGHAPRRGSQLAAFFPAFKNRVEAFLYRTLPIFGAMWRGLVRFMRTQFYWVAIAIALIATPFGIFYPPAIFVIVGAVLAATALFVVHYYREQMTDEPDPMGKLPHVHYLTAEDLGGPLSAPLDVDVIARDAQAPAKEVPAHLIEGSGMSLIERFIPLGEVIFPVTFIANPANGRFQEASIQIGDPLCLWHRAQVQFTKAPAGAPVKHAYTCMKCPGGPKLAKSSLEELKRAVKLLAFSMLRNNKMPIRSETLIDAIRRGKGEAPG